MTHDGPRILIIEAVFYPDIAEGLRAGAMAALEEEDSRVERIWVPGVLEIPAALSMAVDAGETYPPAAFDGYVLLGCVIRGETSHYDIVAAESARAVMDLSIKHHLALGNGILWYQLPVVRSCDDRSLPVARITYREQTGCYRSR